MISIDGDIQSARSYQAICASGEKLTSPCVGSFDGISSCVLHLVLRGGVALRREEQDVFAAHLCQGRCLDVGSIAGSVGQDLYRASDLCSSVLCYLLQHQRCGNDGCDSVAAFTSVANCVAVDFVCNPSSAVCVRVSGRIDGSSFGCRAYPRLSTGVGIRSSSRLAGGIADTVQPGLRLQRSSVVHDERAIVELYRVGRPLSKVSIKLLGDGCSGWTDNTGIA